MKCSKYPSDFTQSQLVAHIKSLLLSCSSEKIDKVLGMLSLLLLTSQLDFVSFTSSNHSPLLHRCQDRSDIHPALPNLGAVALRSHRHLPILIFSANYPAHLLYSLTSFICKLGKWSHEGERSTTTQLARSWQLFYHRHLVEYLEAIGGKSNKSTSHNIDDDSCRANWFIKVEILLLLNIIKSMRWNQTVIEPTTIVQVGFYLLSRMSQELFMEIVFVFNEVAFNPKYFVGTPAIDHTAAESDGGHVTKEEQFEKKMQQWKSFYTNAVLSSLTANQVSLINF